MKWDIEHQHDLLRNPQQQIIEVFLQG